MIGWVACRLGVISHVVPICASVGVPGGGCSGGVGRFHQPARERRRLLHQALVVRSRMVIDCTGDRRFITGVEMYGLVFRNGKPHQRQLNR